jgi:HD-GYP domain-containing protein (c-di-GMP phosphodiesterase class II)
MIDNLHKWLIVRLAIVWTVLTIVIGGMVHFYGNRRLDTHVADMATTETTHYSHAVVSYLESPSDLTLAELNRLARAQIEHDNLIVVEFYDATSRKITEAFKPSAREVEERLPKHGREFADHEGIVCEKLSLGEETYLRVFVPILNPAGTKTGYLEGIYHAPQEIISQIKQQTLWSLALVVLVILATTLSLYPLIIRLNRTLFAFSHNLALTNVGMLKVLGSAIAKRDSDTNIHNYRVTLYSVRLGEKLGLPHPAMQGLIKGAFLHDLGKIAIGDGILHKSGPLTEEEFEIMKSHVRHGEEVIRGYDWLRDARDVVVCHHEKYDGSGYPVGLMEGDIPLNARIFAVADVFDALTSKRPYKEPLSFDAAVSIVRDTAGSHFDPDVARLFLDHAQELHAEICSDDETLLHGKLEACIGIYFS